MTPSSASATVAEPVLKASLFGNALILQTGTTRLPLPQSSLARRLFAHLLFNWRSAISRAQLVGLFWPDLSEKQGRQALRQALWHIRRSLPDEGWIQAEADIISWQAHLPLWVDTTIFQTLLSPYLHMPQLHPAGAAALSQAVTLYQGDLLLWVYDDWVDTPRHQLQAQYMTALTKLLHWERQRGYPQHALTYALQFLQTDPLHEEMHRQVMQLYMILGQPAAALQQFQRCQMLLEREIGVGPEPETTALASTIMQRQRASTERGPTNHPPAPEARKQTTLPLVGRQAERQQLLAPLSTTMAGAGHPGGVFLIEGEAGIGKTRLIQEVIQDATWRGVEVLAGVGQVGSGVAPFGPLTKALAGGLSLLRAHQLAGVVPPLWLQVLSPLIPCLNRWLPNLGTAEPLEPRPSFERLGEGVVQCLMGWASITPILLVIEDLHYVDIDTLEMLVHLAQRLREYPFFLVGSYRGSEARSQQRHWQQIELLDRVAGREHILLRGLDVAQTAQLVRAQLGISHLPQPVAARMYAETQGNPLFVIEIVHVLMAERLLVQNVDGQWMVAEIAEAPGQAWPRSPVVEEIIMRRLQLLPPPTRSLLDKAAVLGNEFTHELFVAVTAIPQIELLSHLRTLIQLDFLRETGQDYRFCHNIIQEVVYRALDPQKRVAWHRRVVEVLAAQPCAAPEMLAFHAVRGAWWAQALPAALAAAQQAHRVYAYQSALEGYRQVLTLLETHSPLEQTETLALRFDVALRLRSLAEVVGNGDLERLGLQIMLDTVARLDDPLRQTQTLNQQALFALSHTHADVYDLATQALTLARQHDFHDEAALALQSLTKLAFRQGEFQTAVEWAEEGLGWCQTTPALLTEMYLLPFMLVNALTQLGRAAAAQEVYARLIAPYVKQSPAQVVIRDAILRANVAFEAGQIDEGLRISREAVEICRAHGMVRNEAFHLSSLGQYYLMAQQFAPGVAYMQQALTLHRQRGEVYPIVDLLAILGEIYRVTGRYAEAEKLLQEGVALVAQASLPGVALRLHFTLVHLYLDTEQVARAHQQKAYVDEILGYHRLSWLDQAEVAVMHGRLAMVAGQPQEAAQHFAQAVQAAHAAHFPHFAALARSYQALATLASGDVVSALQLAAEASQAISQRADAIEPYRTHWYHALILQKAGHHEAAAGALEQAVTLIQRYQAALDTPEWQAAFGTMAISREILAADADHRQAGQGVLQTVQLPALTAPHRGRLRPDQLVTVTWTPSHPTDATLADRQARRHQQLQRLIAEAQAQGAVPTLEHLATALGVSRRTVQYDVATLRAAGHTLHTRGD